MGLRVDLYEPARSKRLLCRGRQSVCVRERERDTVCVLEEKARDSVCEREIEREGEIPWAGVCAGGWATRGEEVGCSGALSSSHGSTTPLPIEAGYQVSS